MAKAGYDPRVALEVWERMEKKEGSRGAPPEFLSTHPGYETRTQQLRAYIPEALKFYSPGERVVERLPSLHELDSPKAKAERELLKRIQAVNKQAGDPRGERAVVEAIGYSLRLAPAIVYEERRQVGLGYGQYAALRALSSLTRSPIRRILADYRAGMSWSDLAESNGAKLTDLIAWLGDLRRTAAAIHGQLQYQPLVPRRVR